MMNAALMLHVHMLLALVAIAVNQLMSVHNASHGSEMCVHCSQRVCHTVYTHASLYSSELAVHTILRIVAHSVACEQHIRRTTRHCSAAAALPAATCYFSELTATIHMLHIFYHATLQIITTVYLAVGRV
jgi:hypothetical protein